jgi:hypothetical protein
LQPCAPAPVSQVSEHEEPGPQLVWQLWSRQVKAQLEFEPQSQLPFEHSPAHSVSLLQSTWHGPASHENVHDAPGAQVQAPLAQLAAQLAFSAQST